MCETEELWNYVLCVNTKSQRCVDLIVITSILYLSYNSKWIIQKNISLHQTSRTEPNRRTQQSTWNLCIKFEIQTHRDRLRSTDYWNETNKIYFIMVYCIHIYTSSHISHHCQQLHLIYDSLNICHTNKYSIHIGNWIEVDVRRVEGGRNTKEYLF